MAEVAVEHLCRRIDNIEILKEVSFRVREGEFLTLLGPSGCGKSTTLNALAGLDRPSSGRIVIGGETFYDGDRDIFVDARYRNLGLMFQSYALWPHMTVAQNLDFTLEIRRIRGTEARKRVMEALELVDMASYASRYPGELSGGQQQRVALARTLVYRPKLLLLDEPLSNLDAKLRDRARDWLRDLQQRTGVTTIYVTHDQIEALSLSDRIIVMDRGRIVQYDTPSKIYEAPSCTFVADFVGASNTFLAEVVACDSGRAVLRIDSDTLLHAATDFRLRPGVKVMVSVRPERIEATQDAGADANNAFDVVLDMSSYQGARTVHSFVLGGQRLRMESPQGHLGARARIRIPVEALRLYPQE
ncbi:ABC transporter ATP-binding protein [Microvirga sp. VF16]|uniref:ABC transporter ATP-binding protein n=1 Tax=Microvirga sp. VF16 TaxID=2807101 RepID=UPI00193D4F79|nr:ABC transporter ATP-binding protein [Microvirga sp. VF16]QRM32657.1 ABC transporter ATP-binding protein [Microvirga sp. VF16]